MSESAVTASVSSSHALFAPWGELPYRTLPNAVVSALTRAGFITAIVGGYQVIGGHLPGCVEQMLAAIDENLREDRLAPLCDPCYNAIT